MKQDYKQYAPKEFTYENGWIKNWFSNFTPCQLHIDGNIWPSVENYYQAQKTLDLQTRERMRRMSPGAAKQFGKKVKLRDGWNDIKAHVMRKALVVKFRLPEWKEKLLATDDEIIIEWNNWGDTYWGVSVKDFKGANKLGELLMQVREFFKK